MGCPVPEAEAVDEGCRGSDACRRLQGQDLSREAHGHLVATRSLEPILSCWAEGLACRVFLRPRLPTHVSQPPSCPGAWSACAQP